MTVLTPRILTLSFNGKIDFNMACKHIVSLHEAARVDLSDDVFNVVSKAADGMEATFNNDARDNEKILAAAQDYFETLDQCSVDDDYCPQTDEVYMRITTNDFVPRIVYN